jgi:hypothetical protein
MNRFFDSLGRENPPPGYEASSSAPPTYEESESDTTFQDAKSLRDATKSMDTDNVTLNRIISRTSLNPQRMILLQETYTQLFNRDLKSDIRGYMPSSLKDASFKDAIIGMIKGPIWVDVKRLHNPHALPPVTAKQVFMEIILFRPNSQLQAIKQMYDRLYPRTPLEKHIKISCPGKTGQLLAMCLETTRNEDGSDTRYADMVRADTRRLHQGIWQHDADMDEVIEIFARSSREKIFSMMEQFEFIYPLTMTAYIEDRLKDDFRDTLLVLLSWAEDPVQYSRDTLFKLFHIQPGHYRDMPTLTHTMLWAHWNRTMFEVGKMRLQYTGYRLRERLEKGLSKSSYQKLMLTICERKY